MDAADAARMSDPDRNRHFSRRWSDPPKQTTRSADSASDCLGAIGMAMLLAVQSKRAKGGATQSEGASHG